MRAVAAKPLSKLVPSGKIDGGTPFRLYTLVAAWRATGRLLLTDAEGTHWEIFFRHGGPELVQTSHPDYAIHNYLLQKEAVDEATMRDGLALGIGLIEALCGAGVLSLEQAHKYLAGYSRALLVRALNVEEGSFEWEVDAERPSLAIPLGDRWKLLSAVGRRIPIDSVMRRLDGLLDSPIAKVADPLVSFDVLGLHPQEARVAATFDGTRSLAGLASANSQYSELIYRTACFLAAAGLVEFFARTPGVSKPAPVAPQPESTLSPALRAEFEDARSFMRTIEGKDHFAVLGLSQSASAAQVREAYFRLAKAFHPDTAPKGVPELVELKERITARLNEAYSALSDDERRAAYLQELEAGEAVDVGPILEAEQIFQRAMLLIKVRKFGEALQELDRAIELNGEEAEFWAYRALAFYFSAKNKRTAKKTAMDQIEKALALNDRCVPAYLVAARISTLAGDRREALRNYERCLELDPKHIEAQRELKLLRSRGKS